MDYACRCLRTVSRGTLPRRRDTSLGRCSFGSACTLFLALKKLRCQVCLRIQSRVAGRHFLTCWALGAGRAGFRLQCVISVIC